MHQRNFASYLCNLACAAAMSLTACSKERTPDQQLAPTASALVAGAPAAAQAIPLQVDTSTSSFGFLMDSALEKIEGEAPQSVQGELFVDPKDLTRSSGLVKADLKRLTLYQQKRSEDKGNFGERKQSELQNQHAQDWLQLNAKPGEVTADQAEMHRFAELKLSKLENLSASDVTQLHGAERKVTATASGELRLHGRVASKSAKLELTFKYAGDKLEAVEVRTLEPFPVALDEFDIHPRDAAGKFVKSLSDAISSNLRGKIAKDAPVKVAFTARPR